MTEQHPVIERGEFPFPVLDRGHEPRQLVWLRNHANYLTGRGLKDYLRAMSSIVRGLIVNLLIGLPYVLALALGVGILSITGWGFRVALVLIFSSLAWVMVSPVANRVWQVARLRRTATTGSDSSIESRDRFESGLGLVLLLTAATALCEALSYFLDTFHLWTRERGVGFVEFVSSATASLGVFTGLARLLPRLAGAKRTVAAVVVSIIGVLLPLAGVLFVADRLVFDPPSFEATIWVLTAAAVLWLVMAVAFLIGLFARAFRRRFKVLAIAGLTLTFCSFALGIIAADEIRDQQDRLPGRLAALDFALDTQFSSPTLTAGRSATARAERTSEVRSLAADIADASPASVDELMDFMQSNVAYSAESANFLNNVPAEPQGGIEVTDTAEDAITNHLSRIYWFAGQLDGAVQLVSDVGYQFEEEDLADRLTQSELMRIDADLATMRDRLEYLTPLFDAYASSPDPTEATDDLVIQVLALFDESVINQLFPVDETNEWFQAWVNDGMLDNDALWAAYVADISVNSPLARQLPAIALYFPDSFTTLHEDLSRLMNSVGQVRIDVAQQAVFSAKYRILRDEDDTKSIRIGAFTSSAIFAAMAAIWMSVYGWLTIDPNRTSLLAMYRDRLAYAFLLRRDPDDERRVKPEVDLDLDQLSRYDVESTAPYHLINCAVNLPASRDITIRDRKSDFFIFSKLFTGSVITGYCRSEKMERVFPDMSVSTAMAISAAAASPNMGRSTSRMLAVVMVLLNLRLGYWVPNPRKLEEEVGPEDRPEEDKRPFTLEEVKAAEVAELAQRWRHLPNPHERQIKDRFFGIAFSGGGIRSATLNLGITQALHQKGVFDHIDYMSTVSGGGYLGSSISVSMRSKQPVRAPLEGGVTITQGSGGLVGKKILTVTPRDEVSPQTDPALGFRQTLPFGRTTSNNQFVYDNDLRLAVDDGGWVNMGERIVAARHENAKPHATEAERKASRDKAWRGTFGDHFHWRTRPGALLLEFAGRVHERSRSVNVSDGGHVENLATIELLRRRCRFIITGDAEMDPSHRFKGLTVLLRTAQVELGVEIDINLDGLRLNKKGHTEAHWAIGRINYGQGADGEDEIGYLLYFKSSFTGREPEDIRGYRALQPAFPHEPTSDQFFDEGQFESYRNLGYYMACDALEMLQQAEAGTTSFADIRRWFETLWKNSPEASLDNFNF